ncbi:hypothetical protein LUZ61_014860 [Rhynchospora tenuis]|uniref:Leucine-rich repeat-containing N-terminal plant-type domain-containing protein n=1 Tax=Rhynchospora tenuis TaxID=198213 RepID=A0AAD5WBU2_9POAL|nr:hypothetical protein LUZ61_014860 [Rhynchospora tenuis]
MHHLKLSALFLLQFLCFFSTLISISCTESEVQALLAWKSSLKDPGCLTQKWSYNISNDPCRWEGIQCSEAGSITNLCIRACMTDGTLDKFNFSSFPNLTRLDIAYQNFHGEIPKEIGTLSNLLVLSLIFNNLSGEIPATISNLSKLTHLDLSGNQLTGSIPKGIVNLSNLYYLMLGQNNLTGEIPTSLENLSNLELLEFSYNYLTGIIPRSIEYLTRLTFLGLSTNELNGRIPLEIGNITALQQVVFSYNNFIGVVPPFLTNDLLISRGPLTMSDYQCSAESYR